MTEYYINEMDGDMYRVNEKRIGLLLNEMWQDIRQDNITLIRFPDGIASDDLDNDSRSFDYAVYTHGKDDSDTDIVIRYYVSIAEDGRYSTDPIPLSYSTYVNDILTYGDSITIEDSGTGEALNTFSITKA